MTLNQLIELAKKQKLDFDSELVIYKHGMEFSSYKSISSVQHIHLRAIKKSCHDAFDGGSYNKTVFEKEHTKSKDTKNALEIIFDKELI